MYVLRLTPFYQHESVHHWPAEFDPIGGMQVQITQISEWLACQGIRQTVLTLGFPGAPKSYLYRDNLRVEQVRLPIPRVRSELTGLVGLTKAWLGGCIWYLLTWRTRGWSFPDLIHVHCDGQPEALLAGLLAKRLLHRPLAFTVHCSRIGVYKPMSHIDSILHKRIQNLELKAVREASAVYCLTKRTARLIKERLDYDADHFHILPDVINLENFCQQLTTQGKKRIYEQYGIPIDQPLLGYFGRIAYEKGWSSLVSILVRITNLPWHLMVVGDGPQRLRFEQALQQAGLAERVTITGFVSHSKIPNLMQSIRILLMPSLHEELGGAAIEAMSCGIPVVAYGVGGLNETVGAVWPHLLIQPENETAFANCICEMLVNRGLNEEEIVAGQNFVRTHFSVERVLPSLLASYQSIVLEGV